MQFSMQANALSLISRTKTRAKVKKNQFLTATKAHSIPRFSLSSDDLARCHQKKVRGFS